MPMVQNLLFVVNSIFLGVGLAMDAFSVSLANGLNEPTMRKKRMCKIAGVFAFFQALMPMAGWLCVHTMLRYFKVFEKSIPWIALVLLVYIGVKMMLDGIRADSSETQKPKVGSYALFIQGVATSIDALSVGFAIAGYGFIKALVCALIIASVTFCICFGGLHLGKRFGTKLSDKATVLGGVILIFIGIEIFVSGIL